MMSKDRKRLSTRSMEAILRVRKYKQILPDIEYEKALELFLTEYPNGEMRKGKRLLSGYVASAKGKDCKKQRGLTLDDTDDDSMNEEDENAMIAPGEDLSDESDYSDSSDSESD